MRRIRYRVAAVRTTPWTDVAYVSDGEDPAAQVAESIMQELSTNLMVTIGGETRHLAAWLSPDHWADDFDEDAVPALLLAAEEKG